MTTPDEFRYAKAHLRAALDHVKLASHYFGNDYTGSTGADFAERDLGDLLAYAANESLKSVLPVPPPYNCPQCGLDANGDVVHTLTHHTVPGHTVEEAKAFLRGDQPLKGI